MLSSEFGMKVSDTIKLNSKLASCISEETKIDSKLQEIRSGLKEAYKSENASILNDKNDQIGDSEYIKIKNLNSYKKYIDKYISKYKVTGKEAEKKSIVKRS